MRSEQKNTRSKRVKESDESIQQKNMLIHSVTQESAAETIRHIQKNGTLHLTAYNQFARQQLSFTLDSSWEIHDVVVRENEFFFIASRSGQAIMKFHVYMKEFVESVKLWLAETARSLKKGAEALVATIPKTIVFAADPTEYAVAK